MPITQDRFVKVITGAKQVILAHDSMLSYINSPEVIAQTSDANSVIRHSDDANTKEAIQNAWNIIAVMRERLSALGNLTELRATIVMEEMHFHRNSRKNAKAAFYQQEARRRNGIQPRNNSHTEVAHAASTFDPAPIADATNTITESEEYKRFERDMYETKYKDHPEGWRHPGAPLSVRQEGLRKEREKFGGIAPDDIEKRFGHLLPLAEPDAHAVSAGNIAHAEMSPAGGFAQNIAHVENQELKPKMGKDGIIRYLPDDDNTTVPPTSSLF